ncbi:MAG: hypothetical protein CBC12_00895 [Candidatus Puniceispirillum sp. TMED52]|nr:hypothetical protein [SAR116 cluster bacterium]OUU54920.1 MAG: hypothetical protein CBC12_00895 [Candidatus Puniceispirillum sp. TMED52]|tara:strand:+ start:1736 stop:2089 length:354 start_codon:yes stop_codon:yes gene_type:complete
MSSLDNSVIGINAILKPKDAGREWRNFVENLVLINKEKGYAFLYEIYELDGIVHLHQRFKDAVAYKKQFEFFSAEIAEEFYGFFEVQKIAVYGEVSKDIHKALAGINAKFFSTVARF